MALTYSGAREKRSFAASVVIWLVNAAALLLASQVFSGVVIERVYMAFVAALVLSIVTLVVEPVLYLLTLPITVATFGLFTLAINGLALMITARLVPWFSFTGGFWERLGWAVAASLVVSFFRTIVHSLLVQMRLIEKK